ncbi:sporulation protein RMD8 [Plectosphaerella cucumerina]|uniref:Sporulation protein RMD8 n=1 Tax=Plectosphaerella cucumerina TaxID=40658 RepID=A0A8K0X8J1_9PEZI|nr:sporulation protein RMD8 [Plectosphaerella cucumerina]
MAPPKRGPSVLVTDSRERPVSRPGVARRETGSLVPNRGPRFMTVDNVLQHAYDIPSGQPRPTPPGTQRAVTTIPSRRVSSGSSVGGGLPNIQSRTGQLNIPSRTTKISEKLVLLPETVEEKRSSDEEEEDDATELARRLEQEENRPLKDEELELLRKRSVIRGKSFAERLPKVQRKEKVARLTAYCTAQSYKMKSTADFLRKKHGAKTKLYDDCLYVIYALPLQAGSEGCRVKSRPMVRTPGSGKTFLDLEIERNEQRDHHEGYFDEFAYMSASPVNGHEGHAHEHERDAAHNGNHAPGGSPRGRDGPSPDGQHDPDDRSLSPMSRIAPDAKAFAEAFLFSYGVVVFWNFTENQEKDILADLTFAENDAGQSLFNRPLDEADFETEEFHFEYSPDIKRPRIYNDMITLMPRSDHMIKLTISHSIAQSTLLCLFEERMSQTMLSAQDVPKRLALTGELNMTRTEIVKILGRLFTSRVDINLSSNILDVPNFFWDSEPTLHPLYVAIREYLEIDPRIKVLNERCRVFLDLAEILSDSVADAKMSYITWIVIILIAVSIVVTVTEVGLRFAMLSKNKGERNADALFLRGPIGTGTMGVMDGGDGTLAGLAGELQGRNVSIEEVRRWSRLLGENGGGLCGGEIVGETFKGV